MRIRARPGARAAISRIRVGPIGPVMFTDAMDGAELDAEINPALSGALIVIVACCPGPESIAICADSWNAAPPGCCGRPPSSGRCGTAGAGCGWTIGFFGPPGVSGEPWTGARPTGAGDGRPPTFG